MLLRTPCTPRIARIHTNRIQWQRTPRRCYSSADSDDPQWFQQLRSELLQRPVACIPERFTFPHEQKLSRALAGFLPHSWCYPPSKIDRTMPFGDHLIWFNPAAPTSELLPDGTDASHSPGGPWVRRMWAGGSIQLKPDGFSDYARHCTIDEDMVGIEHIKQARLHGEGDSAKIFVTIERRFATLDSIERGHERGEHGTRPLGARLKPKNVQRYLQWQVRAQDNDGWGHALFKEERNLVFFKERTAAELEAVKAGQMATVKYLDPPGKPDFSHTLTPTRALLFRFSALTFNAHLIHLDPDYARNVEGHRNLLVHGPLSLILLLKTMNHYVHTQTEGKQALESIEYRNLAPLYCDEEMRICCSKKKKLENGSVYDVWIEGPTGGVAVKGTLRTTEKDPESADKQETQGHSFKRPQHPALRYKMIKTREEARKMAKSSEDSPQGHIASEDQQSSTSHESSAIPEPSTSSEPSSQNQGEIPNQSTPSGITSQPPSREVTSAIAHETSPAYRRNRATNTKAYKFITDSPSDPPPLRFVESHKPVIPTLSEQSKELLRRARRSAPAEIKVEPIPLVRKFGAKPYVPDPARTAARHSRFLKEGARKMEKLKIRHVAPLSNNASKRRGQL